LILKGGIDLCETVAEAATREIYEEIGLIDGKHLELIAELNEPLRYSASGWLANEGFAGQEFQFVLFRSVSALLDSDPAKVLSTCIFVV
jgi:ADP-ribose pyrophosphatase YjhB (NUDIX family)